MASNGLAEGELANCSTASLVDNALSIVANTTFAAPLHGGVSPEQLLRHMLVDAPNEYGQRYIATAVHVAATGEADLVLRLASVFLDDLLLPMLAKMSAVNRLPPSSSPTPILQVEPAAIELEPVDRTEQQELDRLLHIRESRTCCVTGFSSEERALELHASGQLAQVRAIVELETAYVIPLALNSFDEPHSAARTRDMLRSWTNIDLPGLVGSTINTPRNAMLINRLDHQKSGKFKIWFEEISDCANGYIVKTARGAVLANARFDGKARFCSIDDIDPPDLQLLRVHAAFAKVLSACGAADVYAKLEEDLDRGRGIVKDEASSMILTARLDAINYVN